MGKGIVGDGMAFVLSDDWVFGFGKKEKARTLVLAHQRWCSARLFPFRTHGKRKKQGHKSLAEFLFTGLGRGARRALVVGEKNSHLGCFFTRLSSSPSIKVRFPKEKARTKVLAFLLERITGLEPATSTWARSRSTK